MPVKNEFLFQTSLSIEGTNPMGARCKGNAGLHAKDVSGRAEKQVYESKKNQADIG